MLCCHCKKNQATKTYDRITDGKKQTEYYCLDCYHRLFISIEADAAEGKGGDRQIAMCPYCGTSEEDFRACGLVGCAQCYQSLSKAVIPVVIRLQGTETHCGKKQLWGNPLYKWDYHKSTGYAWWLLRLAHVFKLYDTDRKSVV